MNEQEQMRIVWTLQEQMRDQREWRRDVDRQLANISALPFRFDALTDDLNELKTSLTSFMDRIDRDTKERGEAKEQREGMRVAQALGVVGSCGVVFAIVQALFLLLERVIH